MKKVKKQEIEDRYYLLTLALSEMSCLCYIITYFNFSLLTNIFVYSLMILLQLFFIKKLSIDNNTNKLLLSLSISFLSIILIYMLIITFSNNILSFTKISKYFISYILFTLSVMLNYRYLYKNKKILANIISPSICIVYLTILVIVILK